jgi:hypothetical protein
MNIARKKGKVKREGQKNEKIPLFDKVVAA